MKLNSDSVLFTAIDTSGNLSTQSATPATVAIDGTSMTVVVPTNATTGTVRLARDTAGVLLQVVPVLSQVSLPVGNALSGSQMTLTGSGFAEGLTSVNFGSQTLADASRAAGR